MTDSSSSLRSEASPTAGSVTSGNARVHRMRELYESGLTIAEIGLHMHCSPSTAYRALRALGMPFRSRGGGAPGMPATQERVLEFIEAYTKLRGFSPNVREIAEGVGLYSTGTVVYHLQQLELDRRITRVPGIARSIVVIEESS